MNPFPKEHELTEFFGALPKLTDAGVPWFYNCVAFEHVDGADVVRIEIEPASGILRVVWIQGTVERLRLDLNRVRGLSLDRDEGQDVLVAHLVDPRAGGLRLRLVPTVHLQWGDRAY